MLVKYRRIIVKSLIPWAIVPDLQDALAPASSAAETRSRCSVHWELVYKTVTCSDADTHQTLCVTTAAWRGFIIMKKINCDDIVSIPFIN